MRTLFAIERSDVCLMLIDATEGVTDQDAKIAGEAHEAGKGIILVVNKWDEIEKDTNTIEKFKKEIYNRLSYLTYAPIVFISAKTGQRVNKLYPLGEVSILEDSVKLADEPKKIIKIVGDTIRETISKEENINEALITISKVIHAGRYCLSSNSDVKKLSEFTERTTNEVESSIKLVKRIETRIDKQIK